MPVKCWLNWGEVMTDLIKRLRKADEYEPLGHDGWEAADLIEELVKERDRWKDACRSASKDLNIVVPDNDRLKSERDAAEASLAKAVEALQELSTCVEDGCYCSEMQMATVMDKARSVVAEIYSDLK